MMLHKPEQVEDSTAPPDVPKIVGQKK